MYYKGIGQKIQFQQLILLFLPSNGQTHSSTGLFPYIKILNLPQVKKTCPYSLIKMLCKTGCLRAKKKPILVKTVFINGLREYICQQEIYISCKNRVINENWGSQCKTIVITYNNKKIRTLSPQNVKIIYLNSFPRSKTTKLRTFNTLPQKV